MKINAEAMNIEETKREVIDMIAELPDEELVVAVKKTLEEALPSKELRPRKPGWGKGTFTYIAEDFDSFIPPGFNDDNEIFP